MSKRLLLTIHLFLVLLALALIDSGHLGEALYVVIGITITNAFYGLSGEEHYAKGFIDGSKEILRKITRKNEKSKR